MKLAHIQTRCECQGRLSAVLDEGGRVISGAVASASGAREVAPATAMGAGADQFRVGWLCPLCGRNTVRSFYRGALVYGQRDDQAPVAAP